MLQVYTAAVGVATAQIDLQSAVIVATDLLLVLLASSSALLPHRLQEHEGDGGYMHV